MNDAVITLDLIRRQLEVCLSWCCPRLENRNKRVALVEDLRSHSLEVPATAVFPSSCHTPPSRLVHEAFQRFASERIKLCSSRVPDTELVEHELARSRSVLAIDWARSLFDGSSAEATNGYFDDDGMPPWDCWLEIGGIADLTERDCLFIWVPEAVAHVVDAAVFIDAAQCMSWIRPHDLTLVGWGERMA